MYRIVCGENTIFDPEYVNEYPVSEARLSERLNEGGALTFTLVQGHPQYNVLKPMESYITVMDADELIFYGRVIECGLPSFSCQISYTCEGAISFLNDSEVPPNSSRNSTMTAEAFFRHCIAKHNEDINNDPRRTFTVGQVTAENRNKTDTFTLNSYTQTKNAIQNNLLNVYGGYLRIRVADGIRYIDWIEHYSDTVNPQRIVIGTNILERNFSRHWDEGIYTYLRPVGKNNLILDNPLIRVFSQEMVNKYGRIVKSVSFSDISTKQALQQKAEEYIANLQTELICEGDIELVDMQYIDGTSPKARLGDRYDNLEGLAGKELTVTEIERDLTVSYKARLSFGNDKKLSDNRSKALSQKSSRNRSSSGQNFKHIIEVGSQVTINADTLVQHGNTLNTHYELIQQTQNSYERIAADVETLSGEVQTIQGTGVIQNDELLSHFAGTMNIVRDPSTGRVKGLQFVDGTMVYDTVDGHIVTVGSAVADNAGKVVELRTLADGLTVEVQTIKGSTLWTGRDHITGVCGEYEVITDQETGIKTLVIKSGGGMRIRENNVEYGLYMTDANTGDTVLTGGIMVEKINDNSTVTKINGDKVNITATQLAQFGIVDPQTGTLTAGIVAGLINDQDPTQGTVTKIQGDRIIVGDIGTVSGATVDNWMQNAYNGTGVFAKYLTVKKLTAQEIETMFADIGTAYIKGLRVREDPSGPSVTLSNGTVTANRVQITGSGALALSYTDGQSGGYYELTGALLKDFIKKAEVNGNTLTLTPFSGQAITFSKATTLSGAWSGRTFTVSASPQGNTTSDTVYVYPKANAGGDMSIMPVYVSHTDASNQNMLSDTVERFYLVEDVSGKKVNLKKDSVNGSVYAYLSTAATHTAGYNSAHVTSSWSSNVLTFQKTTSGSANSGTETINSVFGVSSGSYYIAATHLVGTNYSTIASTSKTYKLGLSGTKVQIQNSSGTQYSSTPEYTIPLETRSVTTNGTFTPGSGKVGISSITVAVPNLISGSWNNNVYTGTISTSGGTSTSITVTATASIAYDSSTHKYTATGNAVAGGATRQTKTATSGTEAYDAGYGAARISGSWNNNVYTGTISTSGGTSTEITVTATASIAYDSSTHKYTATGNAVAGGATRQTKTAVSGTEAYDAGYAAGASHNITITPDTVGKSSEPTGVELWSTTNFVLNRWYVMTVNCGTASKKYKIKVATSGKN